MQEHKLMAAQGENTNCVSLLLSGVEDLFLLLLQLLLLPSHATFPAAGLCITLLAPVAAPPLTPAASHVCGSHEQHIRTGSGPHAMQVEAGPL